MIVRTTCIVRAKLEQDMNKFTHDGYPPPPLCKTCTSHRMLFCCSVIDLVMWARVGDVWRCTDCGTRKLYYFKRAGGKDGETVRFLLP